MKKVIDALGAAHGRITELTGELAIAEQRRRTAEDKLDTATTYIASGGMDERPDNRMDQGTDSEVGR